MKWATLTALGVGTATVGAIWCFFSQWLGVASQAGALAGGVLAARPFFRDGYFKKMMADVASTVAGDAGAAEAFGDTKKYANDELSRLRRQDVAEVWLGILMLIFSFAAGLLKELNDIFW